MDPVRLDLDPPPPWFGDLGVPAWIRDAEGRLRHLNGRAQRMLGLADGAGLGRACHDVIRGRDTSGAPICGPRCPIGSAALRGVSVEPVRMEVGGAMARPRWIDLVVIPDRNVLLGGARLVHLALGADRAQRLEAWVRRVATRSEESTAAVAAATIDVLTARERTVLDLLARDESPRRVAARLGRSPVTVRNHVQRILGKLGAHSIAEAVARRLLDDGAGASSRRWRPAR